MRGLPMKSLVMTLLAAALVVSSAGAQTTPPPPIIQSVETRWDGVYADLLEVTRSTTGELTVRYRYRNTGKTAAAFPDLRNLIPLTMAVDPEGQTVYGVLKDA